MFLLRLTLRGSLSFIATASYRLNASAIADRGAHLQVYGVVRTREIGERQSIRNRASLPDTSNMHKEKKRLGGKTVPGRLRQTTAHIGARDKIRESRYASSVHRSSFIVHRWIFYSFSSFLFAFLVKVTP